MFAISGFVRRGGAVAWLAMLITTLVPRSLVGSGKDVDDVKRP